MSDIKKIKDEFLLKLKENIDLNQVNQIKTELFGKNGLVSLQFKKLGSIPENERKEFASELNFAIYWSLIFLISDIITDYFLTEEKQ